jgi:electron transport complex protein RnfC
MKKISDFKGGIHPPENKLQSSGQPIASLPLPDRVVLPLQQHIGNPARLLVSVGDQVLKGQKIADCHGLISAAVHAPVSGTVTAIETLAVAHPSGLRDQCIVIQPDGKEAWRERHPIEQPLNASADELRNRIREAGICGLGGAGFPTDVKLMPRHKPVDTLILNAAECEPYITADDRLLRERASEVIKGLGIVAHMVKPHRVLIGIEDNKPEAIAAIELAVQGTTMEVVVIPTKYPSGGEKQLIQILTGKEVPHGGLPVDLGILCHNVGTAAAIYRAVYLDEPLLSRITTVTGNATQRPGNYEVLLGTPVAHVLQQAGVEQKRMRRLVMGGPMMGFTLTDFSVPVVKTTNCLLAADEQEFPDPPAEQSCIRCGFCAEVCPAQLLPQQLLWFARSQQFDKAELYNLADCIECGACAYVCPSSIPLVQYYRYAKGEIRRQKADQQHSDHARERFESRKARLDREQAEKEARRKARAEAAAAQQSVKTEEAGK